MRKNSLLNKIKNIFSKKASLSKKLKACCSKSAPHHDLQGKKYKCQICNRMIHKEHSLEHIKAEEYIINLIKKDHSHWKHKDPTCQDCVEYYRKLVKETEI